jgi:glycosyltransferase involved in cell wall biosynthesis
MLLMQICFFNSNRVWGGGENWHLNTAIRMHERNFGVVIFAEKYCALFTRSRKAGIETIGIRVSNLSFLNPFKVTGLFLLFKKLKPDVVILNLSSDVKLAGIVARLAGIKKIIYRRGLPVPVKNTMMNRFLFRRILTHIIANSEDIKERILSQNARLVDPNKITVIYNGIESESPVSEHSLRKVIPGTHGVILGNAGRLSHEKGQEWLLDMAALLRDKGLDFSLIIAGDGELMDLLKQKSLHRGLENHVFFVGFMTDMRVFYSGIDIYVHASSWEGCSNVILEAMQWKIPVVAFNNSSLPEMIIDGISGFLANDKNVLDLAEKVAKLICDNTLRINYGAAGLRLVHEKFDLGKSLEQLELLIKS